MQSRLAVAFLLLLWGTTAEAQNPPQQPQVCCACIDSSQKVLSCELLLEVEQDPFSQACSMQGGGITTCVSVKNGDGMVDLAAGSLEVDCAELLAEGPKGVSCPGSGLAASAPLLDGAVLGALGVALAALGMLAVRQRAERC